MPDVLTGVLGTPGLYWIIGIVFLAGIVRGFVGFGTALIVLPVAGRFLDPVDAVIMIVVMDAFGPIPVLRSAVRDSDLAEVGRLILGMVLLFPVGLATLLLVSAENFRLTASLISMMLLICIICGLRYHGAPRPKWVVGIGGLSGLMGGAAGLPGPPIILFYMASNRPPHVIRASSTLFLYTFDFLFLAGLAVIGQLSVPSVALGLAMALPAVLGNFVGAAMFRPGVERLYRALAYCVMAAAALSGLPFWD